MSRDPMLSCRAWAKPHQLSEAKLFQETPRRPPLDSMMRATQNAFIESFNGRLRDELLNETLFTSLDQARAVRANARCSIAPTTSLLT